ncbi:MAG: exosortase/archaeosortase family protein [Bryobacteraceae bacterium]|nr:exosortase/archaeosortase family protein [Bryobacteraceae bacterium]
MPPSHDILRLDAARAPVFAALFAVLLIAAYAPVWVAWAGQLATDDDMAHGALALALAGYFAVARVRAAPAAEPKFDWRGATAIGLGSILVAVGAPSGFPLFARLAFVVTLCGGVVLLLGWANSKLLWFPFVLLLMSIPPPMVIQKEITLPLQTIATSLSERIFELLGYSALREGNVLEIAGQRFFVAEACSGIRSLLSLLFLTLTYGYLLESRPAVRLLLLMLAVPAAIVANAARIVATGVISARDPELGIGFFHAFSGWVSTILAFLFVLAAHQLWLRHSGVEKRGPQ